MSKLTEILTAWREEGMIPTYQQLLEAEQEKGPEVSLSDSLTRQMFDTLAIHQETESFSPYNWFVAGAVITEKLFKS